MPQTTVLPIFEQYGITELAERLPMYEESYLLQIKKGYDKPSGKFIKTACTVLRKTREELFGEQEQGA